MAIRERSTTGFVRNAIESVFRIRIRTTNAGGAGDGVAVDEEVLKEVDRISDGE